MDLSKIREKIDELDSELIKVLSERNNLIKDVVKYKQENNIPIVQESRMKDMIKKRRDLAKELGLDQNFVERIFLKILDESIKTQRRLGHKKVF